MGHTCNLVGVVGVPITVGFSCHISDDSLFHC